MRAGRAWWVVIVVVVGAACADTDPGVTATRSEPGLTGDAVAEFLDEIVGEFLDIGDAEIRCFDDVIDEYGAPAVQAVLDEEAPDSEAGDALSDCLFDG